MDSSTSNIFSLLEQLDDEIDDLEEAISPLIKGPLSESVSKLPLLDKAKLYVLVTYAIESMLFCKWQFPTSRRRYLILLQHIFAFMVSRPVNTLSLQNSQE
jgi:hypothetical protein